MTESLRLRVHGDAACPTLIYLPGLHGDWTLLGAFRAALAGQAITAGWLLGESFSSQVAWTLVQRRLDEVALPAAPRATPPLDFSGLILVGGFVKHPWPLAVRLAHRTSDAGPMWLLKRACALYGWSAGRRHGGAASVSADLRKFVARRTQEADRAAITSRYPLIANSDFRPVARRATLPVFQLSGAIDPIVPWWPVRFWLRKHCPGYRESRIIRRAGHNVLLDAAPESVTQILRWVESA